MSEPSETVRPHSATADEATPPGSPEDSHALAQRAAAGDGTDLAPAGAAPVPTAGIAADVSAALAGLEQRPVEEHPAVYETVHRRLGDTLSGIDHI